ncbi:MAG TPA: hypothetical protein VGN99_11430 [Steroidobacteraceae bacterium]|nr:hypothetical protein [Steroidobacteraceae bacterium]
MPDPAPGPENGKGLSLFTPKPKFEYKAPSLLWEYRYLAIFFVIAIIAGSIYIFRAPHKTPEVEAPAPSSEPVYVEPITSPRSIPEPPPSSAR